MGVVERSCAKSSLVDWHSIHAVPEQTFDENLEPATGVAMILPEQIPPTTVGLLSQWVSCEKHIEILETRTDGFLYHQNGLPRQLLKCVVDSFGNF